MMKKKLKINMADPHFKKNDIDYIISKTKNMININLSLGKNVRSFEKKFAKYIGCKYAIATSSCTSALEIALQAVCKEGDEVIIPSQTFVATAMAVYLSKFKVQFVEISKEDFCINFNDLKKKITRKTKAIVLVHFAGTICADFDKIKKLCFNKKIFLIEDAAHSLGAKYNQIMSGSLGDAGCFSFYPTKIITTGEGGMITTNNINIAKFAKSMQLRGRDLSKNKEEYIYPGRNVRMQEFSAILGLCQLKKINIFLKKRRIIAKIYKKKFLLCKKIFLVSPRKINQSSFWKIPILIDSDYNRDEILSKLRNKGIMADTTYTPPVHLQPVIRKLFKIKKGILPKTENYLKHHICLPCHQNMTIKQAIYVAEEVLKNFI
jgi:perosamine synthetase